MMVDESNETPAPLSDAEIAEIAERAAKATPGPWDVWKPYRSDTEDMPSVNLSDAISWGASHYDYAGATIADKRVAALPDATFIVAARMDIPRLLATLAARDARLAALERENAAMREIVAAVAATDVMCAQCNMASRHIHHAADCPVTRARALLATQTPATGATAGEDGEA